jgi:hypothetical protein
LNRESGVDCGVVIDCQKALEYNLSVYNDSSLTATQKAKKYITNYDFPTGSDDFDWSAVLNLEFDPTDPQKFVFAANFKRYTAMCFAIHNDFNNSSFGQSQISKAKIKKETNFTRYKAPDRFITYLKRDFQPLQAMSVDLDFGYTRVFDFFVVGQIYTKTPVSTDVGTNLIAKAKEALALYFAPANRSYGSYPTVMEIVETITNCDENIAYFDAGSPATNLINWYGCDIEYFNMISFARYVEPSLSDNIRIAPTCLISN